MSDPVAFLARYGVEVDPEQPGDGRWREPVVVFGSGMSVTAVLRVEPEGAETWIAEIRSAEVWGYLDAFLVTPDPDRFCVVSNGSALMIGAHDRLAEQLPVYPVTSALAAPECGLLLLADFTSLSAVGLEGVVWTSNRLVLDELEPIFATSTRIECRGLSDGAVEAIIGVDPTTGNQIDGPEMGKFFLSKAERKLRRQEQRAARVQKK